MNMFKHWGHLDIAIGFILILLGGIVILALLPGRNKLPSKADDAAPHLRPF